MNHDQSRPKITVEDLLRVKRAERPPAEFWVRFEQELRAKQLAAIVEKRSWWHAPSRAFAGMARWSFPLGVTAALAVVVFTAREYRRPLSPAGQETSAPAVRPVVAAAAPAQTGSVLSAPAMTPPVITGSASASPAANEPVVASDVRPGEISQVISMLGVDSRMDEVQRDPASSTRLIAANLALSQMIEPDPVTSLGNVHGFETRGLPAARPNETEPLAQMPTPKYRTSARYLTTALPAGYVFETAASHPSEPVRSRVNDRLLRDDSVSRVGVDNGGVFWKL